MTLPSNRASGRDACTELSACLYRRRAQPRELVELWMSGDNSRAVGALSRGAGDMPDPFGVVRSW